MKTIFTFFILFLITVCASAQAPEGIIYQAEARDNMGSIIANENLDVKISILEDDANGFAVWKGLHNVTTNKFGMFVVVIGAGENMGGYLFDEIGWSSHVHFLNVQVKRSTSNSWINMGTTQFLSVPYALHAKTAGALVEDKSLNLKSAKAGVPSQVWSLFGNSNTDPNKDRIGTTDNADLVFITDNVERLRITTDGKLITADGVGLEVGGNFAVHGDSTYIDKDLYVGRDVYLNDNDLFSPKGETFNFGNFTVENLSETKLTGTLSVDGETDLNNELRVNEGNATTLSGILTVDKETFLNSPLTVNNGSATLLTGMLTTNGNGQFESDLNVNNDLSVGNNLTIENDLIVNNNLLVQEKTFTKNLEVKDNLNDGEFLATFENTNDGNGDGIKIKLGKKKSNTNIPPMPDLLNASQMEDIKKLLRCDIPDMDKINLIGKITAEGLEADIKMIGGLTVGIGNLIVGFINGELHLPLNSPDLNVFPKLTAFPGFHLDMPSIAGVGIPDVDIAKVEIGPYNLPSFTMFPEIPDLSLSKIGIGEINIEDPNFWGIPDICLTEGGSNVLTNNNEFIQFTDNADTKMGSIKAVSVNDWTTDYLNPVFLFKLRGALTSAVDKLHARYHFKSEITTALKNYAAMGVEYSSGNGDYAEWLERIDPKEAISTGDIVGVIGGRITKNLGNAEQVMAVSHRPIVLGNVPPDGKNHLGNNIAFMGQIPVKIMGAVTVGDYIVGNEKIPGYGVAIHPEEMNLDDFKLSVGRAWESNSDSGPKMVNTVIGVHNGDYLNILKRYEQKFRESESRLQSVEAKVDVLTTIISQQGVIN